MMSAALLAHAAAAQEGSPWQPAAAQAFGRGGTVTESARIGDADLGFALTTAFTDGDRSAGLGLVATGSAGARDRIRVDLSVPVWPFAEAPGFAGPAAGDVGVQGVVPVARGNTAFAVLPRVWLPTGTDAAGLEGGPAAALLLSLDGGQRASWTLNAGPRYAPARPLSAGSASGSTVALAGALAYAVRPGFRAGLEAAGAAGIAGAVSSAEAALFAQVRQPSGLVLTVSGGPVVGPEAPAARVVATFGWARTAEPADPDPDADGISRDDACPTAAEDADGWLDEDGCPEADNDGDALADADDRCPDVAGPSSAEGCPDSDADGRHDGVDRCPAAAGPARERADVADGCPKRAWATARRLELAGPVRFDLSGNLDEGADDLAAAAAYLLAHPGIGRVEIGGHVAAGWSESEALGISRVRAERVHAVLVAAGVPDERLTAVGYGDTRPLDTNRLASGRARNERIELVLLDAR